MRSAAVTGLCLLMLEQRTERELMQVIIHYTTLPYYTLSYLILCLLMLEQRTERELMQVIIHYPTLLYPTLLYSSPQYPTLSTPVLLSPNLPPSQSTLSTRPNNPPYSRTQTIHYLTRTVNPSALSSGCCRPGAHCLFVAARSG